MPLYCNWFCCSLITDIVPSFTPHQTPAWATHGRYRNIVNLEGQRKPVVQKLWLFGQAITCVQLSRTLDWSSSQPKRIGVGCGKCDLSLTLCQSVYTVFDFQVPMGALASYKVIRGKIKKESLRRVPDFCLLKMHANKRILALVRLFRVKCTAKNSSEGTWAHGSFLAFSDSLCPG